ncbi:unnamed protein product [marine sediment metagenome]|uniref:Core-binding (CB) domain-containing protein n=1 Tax=marine sediment metagenome TaxID=412755 RepID=X1MJS7_9ZZZZ
MQKLLDQLETELRICNYISQTVKGYLYALKEYLAFKKSNLEKLDIENIKIFLFQKKKTSVLSKTINLSFH